jgi:hypothetical protein
MASQASEHHYRPTSLDQQKVAIPRLQRVEKAQTGTKDKRRVPRACTGVSSYGRLSAHRHITTVAGAIWAPSKDAISGQAGVSL